MNNRQLKLCKASWQLIPLGQLAYEVSERVSDPDKSAFNKFVGLEHFISGDLKISKYSSTDGLVSAAKKFKSGDVLFARRNAYLKRASLVDFDGVCSGDAFVLRENNELIVPGFLALIVNSEFVWEFANSNAEGTMSKRVKWRDLESLEIAIPSIPEQARIMELIKALEDSLDLNYKTFEKLQILKESLIQESFFKSSNIKRKEYRFDEIIESIVAGTSVNCEKHLFSKNDKGVLKTSSITGNRFDPEEVKVVNPVNYDKLKCNVEKSSILFNRKNTKQLVGSSKYIDKSYANIFLPDLIWSIQVNEDIVIPKFFWFYLSSKRIRGKISSLSNGTNESMVNISQKQFFKILAFLPCKAYQEKKLNEFENLEKLVIGCRMKINSEKALRKSIIQKVF